MLNNQAFDEGTEQMLSINDWFPNEILEQILNKAEVENHLTTSRLVCKRWKYIIDEMIGFKITVTSFYPIIYHLSPDIRSRLPTKNLKNIQTVLKNPHIAIQDLTIGVRGILLNEELGKMIKNLWDNIDKFPGFAFPHVLKSLSCFEPVATNIFSSLKPLSTLQTLNLSLFSLASLSTSSLKEFGLLRCLTTLKVSEIPTYPEFNILNASEQLNALLINLQAPNLVNLYVAYPIQSLLDIQLDGTRNLMDLIRKSVNLKKLGIYVCSPNRDIVAPSKEFQYPTSLLQDMDELGERLDLTSMELKDNHLHSIRPSTHVKAWSALMKRQKHLKALKFHLKSAIQLSKDVTPIILMNADTLKTLELSCYPCDINDDRDVFFIPIYCGHFKNCTQLENLIVSDRLMNTKYLPGSLKYIYVDAMLSNEDVKNILLCGSGLLENIELRETRGGTPKGFGYGVAIDTLRNFVKFCPRNSLKMKVKRLRIYVGCMDGNYPAEGIFNGDEQNPMQLKRRRAPLDDMILDSLANLTHCQTEYEHIVNYIRFDWILNERGYYEDNLAI